MMHSEPWKRQQYVREDDGCAASYVSRNDAREFCKRLTIRERTLRDWAKDWEYRLPTEAEWEYACRAGTTTTYWYGNDTTRLGQSAWWGGSATIPGGNTVRNKYAQHVGTKDANPFGLHDTHGNVSEWCEIVPPPPVDTEARHRGGGWDDTAAECRSAAVSGSKPTDRSSAVGFRIVLAPVERPVATSVLPTAPTTSAPASPTPATSATDLSPVAPKTYEGTPRTIVTPEPGPPATRDVPKPSQSAAKPVAIPPPGATNKNVAARSFVGQWRIVAESGVTATHFTLTASFTAKKSHVPNATGDWEVVGNEARITWSDGWRDILRLEAGGMLKVAFKPGTTWGDSPTNTQKAIRE